VVASVRGVLGDAVGEREGQGMKNVRIVTNWKKRPDCTFCDEFGNYMGTDNLCPCGTPAKKEK
jgi:hypothetical protein